MEFEKDKKYTMRVKRVDFFNGRKSYIVEYGGEEFRVRKYEHQADNRQELVVEYIGDNSFGKPQFQQDYTDVLYEIYEEDCVYPFKLVDECVDPNTGAFYYLASDEYGFRHRLYAQKSPMYKVGDSVECRVLAVENRHLNMELLPKATPAASFALGDLVNLKNISVDDPKIDFSLLNAEMDTTLRDYQIENKRKIYQAWQQFRSVMLQMPTGTGKTRLFVSIARDLFNYGVERKRAIKILFLAHRKELIEQISDHLGNKYRLAHGLIISQSIEQKKFPMQVGSVPTLTRRLERWEDKDFDIIIIDEAHHVKAKSYKKIIDFYPNAKILGVTATPYRLNGAGFRPEFDELITSPSVAEFIKRGYLSEYEYYSIRPTSELQKQIDRMKLDFEGDYKESEMMGVMDRDYIRAGILSTYQKYAAGKKGIIYTISRVHNTHLAAEFNQAGIKSAAIDSETPKEKRDELVAKFRRGEIQVLFNVNIFSEGFDCPDVEVIQLARPTKSLAMYLQQVGRGLRPHGSKEKLIILDNVGLFNKFGFPSARRKWRYHFEGHPVDETPQAHLLDHEEDREVMDIFEGDEAVEMLHDSRTEDVGQTSLDGIEHDYSQSFLDYTKRVLNEHTAQSYTRSIRPHLDEYIRQHLDPAFKSVFNIIDKETLKTLFDLLREDDDFVDFNNQKHHVFTAAMNRYLDFADWYAKNSSGDIPLLPIEEPEEELFPNDTPEQTEAPAQQDVSDEDIDAEIASIERVIAFHKKKGFPIPKEMLLELARLKDLKKSRSQSAVVTKEIEEQIISNFDLSNIESVSYYVWGGGLDVKAGFDYQAELRDERDMNELTRLMAKLHLELPQEVQEKLELLEKAKDIQDTKNRLYNDIFKYVYAKKEAGVHIRSITFSKEQGLSVQITDQPYEPYVHSYKPKSASKVLTITFPDGTVIRDANASETFVQALEKIGIERIKALHLTSFKRPFIDSEPHKTYQSHQLSTGEYVCTNLGNERKIIFLNMISEKLDLDIVAELK